MKQFSLLIKPASADCNLACDYCFYLDRARLYPATSVHRMTDATLEALIKSYMATDQPQYVFGWQGGESTLMGVEFFRRVTALQEKHGRSGSVVANGLQTNAVLIDEAFARHLAEYSFLVGVSLDGPPEIHDHYRRDASGAPSHGNVMKGVRALRRNRVEFNILTLVTAANAARGREVYRYLADEGYAYHQYIPCVEFDDKGSLAPYAVTGDQWGDFLCAVFDEWVAGGVGRVSVRLFDSLLVYLTNGSRNVCSMGRNCTQYFLVEFNGDVYPCDFFVNSDLKLGNIEAADWDKLRKSPKYKEFGKWKSVVGEACRACEYYEFCAGDCLKHRFRRGRDPRQQSVLCAGWKHFYAHALPALRRIAGGVKGRCGREAQDA